MSYPFVLFCISIVDFHLTLSMHELCMIRPAQLADLPFGVIVNVHRSGENMSYFYHWVPMEFNPNIPKCMVGDDQENAL